MEEMMNELREKLREYKRIDIVVATGLSFTLVNQFMSGRADNPRASTLQAFQDFIEKQEANKK